MRDSYDAKLYCGLCKTWIAEKVEYACRVTMGALASHVMRRHEETPEHRAALKAFERLYP